MRGEQIAVLTDPLFGSRLRFRHMTHDEVVDTLVGLGYDRDKVRLAHSGPDLQDVIVFPLKDHSLWEQEWRTLRDLVPDTDRWPLVLDEPFIGDREMLRFSFCGEGSESAEAALALAPGYDAAAVFESYEPFDSEENEPSIQQLLKYTGLDDDVRARWIAEAAIDLGSSPSLREAERWLVGRQIVEEPIVVSWDDLWSAMEPCPYWIALVPGSDQINGLAYVSAFDSMPVRNLAVCRRWADDHQVELVGAVGCSYLFEMPEPVTDPDQAWRLAVELLELWDCSAGGAPAGIGPLELAPILTQVTRFDGTTFP